MEIKKSIIALGAAVIGLGALAQTSGRVYPERNDDLAWENDLVAFRAYGPKTQRNGERSFGYDIFLKYPGKGPVLETLYANQCSPANWAKVDSLKRIDPKLAKDFENSFTYHLDHGLGMDCYAVGPTLGCGVAALTVGDSVCYPWCYDRAEILENGPRRFKVQLTFAPVCIDGDNITEVRTITLDKGKRLNHCEVEWKGLSKPRRVVAGFPRRSNPQEFTDAGRGLLAMTDPTQGSDNGTIFLGLKAHNKKGGRIVNLDGHTLLSYRVKPGEKFSYDFGYAWDRGDIRQFDEWIKYLTKFKHK